MLYRLILLIYLLSAQIIAQSIDAKFNIVSNTDSVCKICIQIKAENNTASPLGNATFRFKYDSKNLIYPRTPRQGIDYRFMISNSMHYLCSVTRPYKNIISINIYYKAGETAKISQNTSNIVTITFKKKNSVKKIKFNPTLSEFYSPKSSKRWKIKVIH